jgi:hypothetical protein
MHVLSDQSVHITHTYCCVSKLSKFGAYLYSCVHSNTFFVFEKFPIITSLNTFRRIEFSVALLHLVAHLFMFLLIFNERVPKITFVLVLTYYIKPHLFVILTAIATENSMLKFLTVSSVSSDSIVKGIIDDIVNTATGTCFIQKIYAPSFS